MSIDGVAIDCSEIQYSYSSTTIITTYESLHCYSAQWCFPPGPDHPLGKESPCYTFECPCLPWVVALELQGVALLFVLTLVIAFRELNIAKWKFNRLRFVHLSYCRGVCSILLIILPFPALFGVIYVTRLFLEPYYDDRIIINLQFLEFILSILIVSGVISFSVFKAENWRPTIVVPVIGK
jgi:hypothetical protein